MSSEITIDLAAWEASVLSDMDPSQAGRVRKVLHLLNKLYASALPDRPNLVINMRSQAFTLVPEIQEIEQAVSGVYRYAKPDEIQLMLGLLEWRDITVTNYPMLHRKYRCMNTIKGKIVF